MNVCTGIILCCQSARIWPNMCVLTSFLVFNCHFVICNFPIDIISRHYSCRKFTQTTSSLVQTTRVPSFRDESHLVRGNWHSVTLSQTPISSLDRHQRQPHQASHPSPRSPFGAASATNARSQLFAMVGASYITLSTIPPVVIDSPRRIVDETGLFFTIGLVGSAIIHAVRGYRLAPAGLGRRIRSAAIEAKSHSTLTAIQLAAFGGVNTTVECMLFAVRGKVGAGVA